MAITFPASPSDGDVFTNTTTGVKYIYNATDGVWKTHVWPTNTDYLQLSGGTLTGDLSLGTNDLTAQDVTASGAISANSISTTAGLTVGNGLTVSDGNVVMASGHGIDFSATANSTATPGMSNELLDDYEEGTWTPTVTQGTLNTSNAQCRYVKIGNKVSISGIFYQFSNITSTDGVTIGGLPFARASYSQQNVGSVFLRFVSMTRDYLISYIDSTTTLTFFGCDLNDTGYDQLDHQHLGDSTNTQLRTQIEYYTE
jgi:hypothetical protein